MSIDPDLADDLEIFEQMLESVAIYDRSARILYANAATERLFGKPREELLGRVLWELFPDAVGNPFHQAFLRVAESGRTESFEHHFSPWGRWFDNRVYPTRRGICVIAWEVTEQKRLVTRLEALAHATRAFVATGPDLGTTLETVARTLAELVGDSCVVRLVSADGEHLERAVYFSTDPAALATVGPAIRAYRFRLNEGLAGQALARGEPVIVPRLDVSAYLATVSSSELREAVLKFPTRSAMAIPMIVRGRVVGVLNLGRVANEAPYDEADLSLVRDLAARAAFAIVNAQLFEAQQEARHEAEQAAERTARMQRLTGALSGALRAADVAQILVSEGCAAVGATSAHCWLHATDGASLELAASHGPQGPRIVEYHRIPLEAALPTCEVVRTGQPLWFSSRDDMVARFPLAAAGDPALVHALAAVPILAEGRGIGALIVVFPTERSFNTADRDLLSTMASQASLAFERCRLFEAERAALSIAHEANRRKNEFLAILGHELRNPLAPILTAVELMRAKQLKAAERELAIIERQGRHLVRLVDELLDVSRITRGLIALDRAPIELATVLAKAQETTSTLVQRRSHTLTIATPPHDITVLGDEMRLTQVFANLLGNAAKYTAPGGHIDVGFAVRGREVAVTVTDDGSGISPELLPLVFDPFVQGERALDRSDGGMGLGLALVRTLTELHGGRVSAQSRGAGKGSSFEVVLPLLCSDDGEPKPREEPSAPVPEVPRDPRRRRVLVVDDNRDAVELLAEALVVAGHEVQIASSSHEALRLANTFHADVAVLDIGLPVMDGCELGQKLRARLGPSLRLIAVTGYGQDADRERTRAAGFDAHLVKPIRLDALVRALPDEERS